MDGLILPILTRRLWLPVDGFTATSSLQHPRVAQRKAICPSEVEVGRSLEEGMNNYAPPPRTNDDTRLFTYFYVKQIHEPKYYIIEPGAGPGPEPGPGPGLDHAPGLGYFCVIIDR